MNDGSSLDSLFHEHLYHRSSEYRITIGCREWFFVVRESDDKLLTFLPTSQYTRPTKVLGLEKFSEASVGTEFIVKRVHSRKCTTVEYMREDHTLFVQNLIDRISEGPRKYNE